MWVNGLANSSNMPCGQRSGELHVGIPLSLNSKLDMTEMVRLETLGRMPIVERSNQRSDVKFYRHDEPFARKFIGGAVR